MANPYQILRLQPDADQSQIEEAYHRMRRLVSYRNAGSGVTEQAVNTAYTILSDPQRRRKVDEALGRRRRSTAPATQAAPAVTPDRRTESLYARLLRMIPFL